MTANDDAKDQVADLVLSDNQIYEEVLAQTGGIPRTNLGSLVRGNANIRQSKSIDSHGPDASVEFDFAGVRTMSDSLADELFAVLVEEKGEIWFRQHNRVLNLSPVLRQSPLQAVQSRLCDFETA